MDRPSFFLSFELTYQRSSYLPAAALFDRWRVRGAPPCSVLLAVRWCARDTAMVTRTRPASTDGIYDDQPRLLPATFLELLATATRTRIISADFRFRPSIRLERFQFGWTHRHCP